MSPSDHAADIGVISRIEAVPTLLEVVCRSTGLGFAAVAKVTENSWIACGVRNEIGFGLKVGDELKVETTICHDVRQNRAIVVIDHVAEDPFFCNHPAPALYGFQSYISMPIITPDGRFFGTLCALDPRPARLKTPATVGMFTIFAQLIGLQIAAQERVFEAEEAEKRTRVLEREAGRTGDPLAHDLNNILTIIQSAAELLKRPNLPDHQRARHVEMISNATDRAGALIARLRRHPAGA